MKAGFYYLDFKNSKIYGPLLAREVCVTGRILKQHPEDFEIISSHRAHVVTDDFFCHKKGYWQHNPLRPVNARKVEERLSIERTRKA